MDPTPEQVKKAMNRTPGLTESTIKPFLPYEWGAHSNFRLLNCDITYLPHDTSDFKKILKMLDTKKFTDKKVIAIHRVENPYLYSMFLLKKAELQAKFGRCTEQLFFHGTEDDRMACIVLDNFNWRCSKRSSIYKQGIYLTNCCKTVDPYAKFTLLVVKVLIANPLKLIGYEEPRKMLEQQHFDRMKAQQNFLHHIRMEAVPRDNHDAVITPNDSIAVKYDDHCFYPEYVVSLGYTKPKVLQHFHE